MMNFFKKTRSVEAAKSTHERLIAFTTAKEIRPMTAEEIESITGAGTGSCTKTNEYGSLCVEHDTA